MIKLVKNEFFIYSKETRIESNRSFYGSFRIGPFDAGQSITIANALRRTLLSELKGLAITSAEIEGAFHEYSALPGVKDSVLDILLNLKDIVLKSVNYGNKKKGTSYAATFSQAKLDQIGYLKTRGPGIVTASELKLPPGIQCVDPDQYIATLSEEGSLNLKFTINEGKNYIVPSSPHTKNDLRKAPSGPHSGEDEDEREHSLSTLFMEGKGPVSPLSPKQSKQSPLFSRVIGSEEKGALKKRSKVKVVLSRLAKGDRRGHMNAEGSGHFVKSETQSAKQPLSIKKGDKKGDKKSDKKSDKGALSSQVQRGEGSPSTFGPASEAAPADCFASGPRGRTEGRGPKERGKGVSVLPHKVTGRVSKKLVSKGRGKGVSKEEGSESRESLVGAASFFTRGAATPGHMNAKQPFQIKRGGVGRFKIGRSSFGESSLHSVNPILNLNLKKGCFAGYSFSTKVAKLPFFKKTAPSRAKGEEVFPSPLGTGSEAALLLKERDARSEKQPLSLREPKARGRSSSSPLEVRTPKGKAFGSRSEGEAAPSPSPKEEERAGAGSYLASLLKESGHMNRWTEGRGAVKKKRLWLYKIRLASFSTREQGTFLSIKNRDDRLYKIPSHFKTSRRSFSPFSLSLETLPLPFNQNNKSGSLERRASPADHMTLKELLLSSPLGAGEGPILKKSNLIKKATKGATRLLKLKKESEVGNLGHMNAHTSSRRDPKVLRSSTMWFPSGRGEISSLFPKGSKGARQLRLQSEAPSVQNRPYFLLAFALSKREVHPSLLKKRRKGSLFGSYDRASQREGSEAGPSLTGPEQPLSPLERGRLWRRLHKVNGEREEKSEFLQRDPKNKEASLFSSPKGAASHTAPKATGEGEASPKQRSQERGKRTFLNIKEGLSFHKQKKDLLLPSSISPRSIKLSEKREEGLMASKAVPLAIDAVFMPVNKVNYIIERNAAELMIKNAFSNSKSGSETARKRSRLRDSFFSYGEKRVASGSLATHLDQKRIATLGSYDPLSFRRENQAPLKNTFYKSSLGEPFPYYKAGLPGHMNAKQSSPLGEGDAPKKGQFNLGFKKTSKKSKSTMRSLWSLEENSEEEEKTSNFKRALSKDLRSRGVGTALPSEPLAREARRVARRVARTSMFFFKSAAARNVHHLIGTQAFLLKEKRAPLASLPPTLLRTPLSKRVVSQRIHKVKRPVRQSVGERERGGDLASHMTRTRAVPKGAATLGSQREEEVFPLGREKQSRGKNSNIANVPQYYVCNPYKNSEKRIQGDNQRITPLKNNIVFEIWTNGSIHPRQALYEACKNLLSLFSQLENATPLAFPLS